MVTKQSRSNARCRIRVLIAVSGLLLAAATAGAQGVEVTAFPWEPEVSIGQSFIYQIRVTGGSSVEEPQLPGIAGFEAEEIPRRWLWNYANDRFDPGDVGEGRNFFFRFIALSLEATTIPPIPVEVDGRVYRTPLVSLRVGLPPENQEFRFALELAKREVYVGEPVVLNATWYYLESGAFYSANLPILKHPDIELAEQNRSIGSGRMFLRGYRGSNPVAGRYGTATIDGIRYKTITFEEVLVPLTGGSYDFPPSTVQIWTASTAERDRGVPWRRYDQTVVGSNPLRLEVKALPQDGRPAEFTGVVGVDVTFEAEISKDSMHVGDPLTLDLQLSGPPALDSARIPDFSENPELARDFVFGPDPMSSSMIETAQGRTKRFRQTVRVKREEVDEFPPLELWYFNTERERYEVARSRGIPIDVLPTRVVTAEDLEGATPSPGTTVTSVREFPEGIRFNYSVDAGLLAEQHVGFQAFARRPVMLVLAALPMALFALVFVRQRRVGAGGFASEGTGVGEPIREPTLEPTLEPARQEEPEREQPPLGELLQEVAGGDSGDFLEAFALWRDHLRRQLSLGFGTPTFPEIARALRARHVDEDLIASARELFFTGEAWIYGAEARRENEEMTAELRRVAVALDNEVRRS